MEAGVSGDAVEQARRLKELEKENGRLRRLVAELTLDIEIFKEVARRNFCARHAGRHMVVTQ